ncbi:MAG: ATP-dependent DNA helicase RecG [Candidatus Nanopelagicales bacterium]
MTVARVSLASPVSAVAGGKTAKALRDGLGIVSVDDLLRHYPRRYIDPGELTDLDGLAVGEHVTVFAEVVSATNRRMQQRKGTITEVVVSDGVGRISLVFFNQPWRADREFRVGRRGLFAGTVSAYGGTRQLAHPRHVMIPDRALHAAGEESSLEEDRDREAEAAFADLLIPIYPATSGLPSWKIQRTVRLALDSMADIDDPLPASVRIEAGLIGLGDALQGIHRPADRDMIEAARRRLRFEEAFDLQVVLAQRRQERLGQAAVPRPPASDGIAAAFDRRLRFPLTGAQARVGQQIATDLSGEHPMQRLIQGDVGSGKTLVALRAMLQVVDAGAQAALLAPTEVLAQQHLRTLREHMGELAEAGLLGAGEVGTRIAYLSGSQSARQRREQLAAIGSGEAGIVVGTHALLEESVEFHDLGLVVVDEQHRFGVEQRSALASRGPHTRPHVLVMTATPIPRTVAMTVFGDLDVSVIDEYPPGRGRISTHVVAPREHPAHLARAWNRVREEVAEGRRVFVVCPRIGDEGDDPSSDEVDGGTATDDGPALSSVLDVSRALEARWLAGLRIGVLHGRMSADEKDDAMRRFSLPPDDAEAIDVLVATTVIEVGVDVPEASMMVILDAERFGISQLHQLRGRIARGGGDGLCLLVTGADPTSPSRERLDAVAATTDGFALARVDLETRREGDILGTAQSGRRSSLRLLEVIRDESLVEEARHAAQAIVADDPDLGRHPALRERIRMLSDDDRADFLEKG